MITSSYLPSPGRFLISEPFMDDENFQRTVILLVEHGPNGSLGFVINRQLKTVLADIVESMLGNHTPVYLGGPVEQDSLHYIHTQGAVVPDSREIYPGLYWGGDFETIRDMMMVGDIAEDETQFFVGYSGWATGQLDRELRRKSWIVSPENTDFVFHENRDSLWKEILRTMGAKYQVLSNYPTDPSLN